MLRLLIAPVLLTAATLASRRWGHQVGGWLVALPLTSGPVAWFLTIDQGPGFAADAAVGMLAGTASQIAFAIAYRQAAARGWKPALVAGCGGFTVSTLALAALHPPLPLAAALVVVAMGASLYRIRRRPLAMGLHGFTQATPPRWDLPARMAVGTVIVFSITALAPVIGAHVAGLLSPLPVFGAVLAVFSHRTHGPAAAHAVLDGLVVGMAAPAAFFLVLASSLTSVGLPAFVAATVVALLVQGGTLTALRVWSRPATSPADTVRLRVEGRHL